MNKNKLIFAIIILIIVCIFVFIFNKGDGLFGSRKIILESGEHFFSEDLIVNKNEILVIMPGAHLKFSENKKILAYGKISALGAKEDPIIFQSAGDFFWRGIKIIGENSAPDYEKYWAWLKNVNPKTESKLLEEIKSGSFFRHCHFLDISNKENKLTDESRWIGAVEAYNASLTVSNSLFENILHLGGVVTQGSYSVIKENDFLSDEMHKQINHTKNSVSLVYNNKIIADRKEKQGCADGIWIVDSTAFLYSNIIKGTADDGINTMRSYVIVGNNDISASRDDGIDVESVDLIGESIIFNNTIENASGHGIKLTSADSFVFDNEVKNSYAGLTLRDGAVVLASELTLKDNNTGILISNTIPCALSEEDFLKVKKDILAGPEDVICSKICPGGVCLPDSDFYTNAELVEILEANYTGDKSYYFYNKDYLQRDLRQIFQQRTNIIGLNPLMNNEIIEKTPFCSGIKNSLFLEELEGYDYDRSQVQKSVVNDFSAEINDKINEYGCDLQDNDYLCELKNKERQETLINDLENKIERFNKFFE